jgi:hypothetical protein
MIRRAATFLLINSVFLVSCGAASDVKYADLRPATTATISRDTVMIHIGSDLTNSACFTRPKARIDGHTVFISGYRTLRKQNRDFPVRLPPSASSPPVAVVWVDPDGRHVSVPTAK